MKKNPLNNHMWDQWRRFFLKKFVLKVRCTNKTGKIANKLLKIANKIHKTANKIHKTANKERKPANKKYT
jgi:hypothetical protein